MHQDKNAKGEDFCTDGCVALESNRDDIVRIDGQGG